MIFHQIAERYVNDSKPGFNLYTTRVLLIALTVYVLIALIVNNPFKVFSHTNSPNFWDDYVFSNNKGYQFIILGLTGFLNAIEYILGLGALSLALIAIMLLVWDKFLVQRVESIELKMPFENKFIKEYKQWFVKMPSVGLNY